MSSHDRSTDAGASGPRIVLVGHCVPDAFLLRSAVRRALPDAEVLSADDEDALAAAARSADLLLVNRLLDGSFNTTSGVELIRTLTSARANPRPAAMLISNYEEAQAEAVKAGAVPGFGKRDANSDTTARLLRDAIAKREPSHPA